MTANEIIDRLIEVFRFREPNYVTVREMRMGSGYGHHARTIDLWVMDTAPSKGCPATSYEVKVSRADFCRDIRNPDKQRGARMFSDRFYYVAPVGVIPPEQLPPWAGLIEIHPPCEVHPAGNVTTAVTAFPCNKNAPTWPFVVSLLRRVTPSPS